MRDHFERSCSQEREIKFLSLRGDSNRIDGYVRQSRTDFWAPGKRQGDLSASETLLTLAKAQRAC